MLMSNVDLSKVDTKSVGGLYGDFNVDVSSNCSRYGDCYRKSWNITQGLFATKLKYKRVSRFNQLISSMC